MAQLALYVAVAWTAVLVAVAIGVLVRAPSPFVRILAVDTIVLLVVAVLLVLAGEDGRSAFVDAAAALALLGFATTVALVRVEREGGSER